MVLRLHSTFAVEGYAKGFKSNVALDTSLDCYDSKVTLKVSSRMLHSTFAVEGFKSNVALDVNLDAWF